MAMIIGLLGTCYDAVAFRFGMFDERSGRFAVLSDEEYRTHAAQMHDALAWVAENTPRAAIVQHNPGAPGSADGILASYYQRRQVVLSDWNLGTEFGVSDEMYWRVLHTIAPIFVKGVALSTALTAIDAGHIDYVLVTARDPVWNDAKSWTGSVDPIYTNAEVKVFSTAAMRHAR